MQSLTVPVLTIHGTKDRNAPYGAGREWAMKLRNARLLTIEMALTTPGVDAPGTIFPALQQFLEGRWPEGAKRLATDKK